MEKGTERALRRAGHTTLLVDDAAAKTLVGSKLAQRWVLSRARRFKPDFVFLSKCLALSPETVAAIIDGKQNAMWFQDAHWYKSTYRQDVAHVIKIGKLAQTFFVSGFAREWAAHGLRAKFLPSCADSKIRPVPPKKAFAADIAFIGTGDDPARANFLLKVAKKYDLKVWGRGWQQWRKQLNWSGRPAEEEEFAAVCSSSRIVLGVSASRYTAAAGNTTSEPTWQIILAGGFFLGDGTPELKLMLREGDHCAWYNGIDSCLAQCAYYLENSAQRERIRREGQVFVREHHTFDQRIHNLLSGEAFHNPLA
jgi:glycosyl transferase family 1